jgi:hypothetical protein
MTYTRRNDPFLVLEWLEWYAWKVSGHYALEAKCFVDKGSLDMY